jgi:ubiquinone/menaquinone biosynthesis C-methylase UbiE
MNVHDVNRLACPDTGTPLVYRGSNLEMQMMDGVLISPETGEAWSVELGIARLYRNLWRVGSDANVAEQSDRIPAFLDQLQAFSTLLAGGGRMGDFRQKVVDALELDGLTGRERARMLEVGIGTAANMASIQANVPDGTHLELWGTDLSMGALTKARARLETENGWLDKLTLFLADPAHLPFQAGIFDRVLVCGGFDCFRDPAHAMSELSRVVHPDGRVVIIDKQPASQGGPGPLGRFVLSRVSKHAVSPAEAPTRLIPDGARNVRNVQLTPIHYALSFQPPAE